MKTFLASVLCLASLLLHAAPPNDLFANRTPLVASGSISVSGYNANATQEAGDPTVDGKLAWKSVWWTWTSPVNNQVSINTIGSSFDTLLGVFTGSALGALTSVGENDDGGVGYTSRVIFNAVAGIPYQILVGGVNGAAGSIVLNVVVPTGSCSYTITTTSKAFPYTGGNATVTMLTQTGCPWTAISNDSWITITSGSGGTGSSTIVYSVAANVGTSRSGTMTIGGQTFTVTQGAAPGCIYLLSPSTFHTDFNPITNSVTMTAGTGCAWAATPNASWITLSGVTNGTGNGTITYIVATNTLSNQRIGTITAGGQTHTVTQDGTVACTFSISPTSAPFTSSGGTSNIVVSTLTGCMWTASSPVSWVTFSSTNGTGNGTVTYTVAANTNTVSRSTILTVATQPFTVTQGAAACSYSISPTIISAPSGGASSTVAVTTTTGCAWTAVANASWITITSGSSGSGSGTVAYTVAANVNTATRSGTVTIATQTFTVNQAAAPCIYTINPTSSHFSATSQAGSIAVTAGTGCAWTAVSNDAFITINSGTPGSGNGTVGYTVAANVTTSSRTGTITAATKTFTVTQDGTVACAYSILPTSCACASTAGSSTIAVTANAGCAWSVTSSDPSWLTFTPASGTGNGTVTYTITANTTSIQRTATLTIANQIFTVQQAGIGCSFTVTPTTATYTYAGGTGTATVTAGTGCSWSSTSDSAWITITSGSSGTGNGSVAYSVSATSATTNRTGRLTIAGKVLNITQTGAPCSASLSSTSSSSSDTGGGGVITLTESDPSCPWTASSNVPWITVAPASGTGSGSITYVVSATTINVSRVGILTIAGLTFTVTQAGDTTLPVVSLTAPANGSTVSNVITLTATASDNISVSRVDFYLDSAVLLGTDSTSPYSLPYNTTNVANGAHTFYARGFDPANNQGSSSTNTVTISNSAPVASTNEWVLSFGGTGDDIGRTLAVDPSGNVIVAGYYSGSATFAGTTLTNAGGVDMFLGKYASDGTQTWIKRFGFTGSEIVNSIALDTSGNIYAAGQFSGTANFGGTNMVSAGGTDMWIAKYSTLGAHVWSEQFGGTGSDVITGITVDSTGSPIVCGTFRGTVNVGNTNWSSQFGSTDMFVAKYSNLGAHLWSKTFSNDGDEAANAVAVDSSDNVFLGGTFAYVNFGGGDIQATDGQDAFVCKLSPTNAFIWAIGIGGTSGQRGYSIAVDSAGDVILTGDYNINMNPGGGTPFSSGDLDGFVGKYSGVNGAYQWAKAITGSFTQRPTSISTDSAKNVFLTGTFNTGANFGSGVSLGASPAGNIDIFLAKYSTLGVLQWAKSFGGPGGDFASSVAVYPDGHSFVTGNYTGIGTFNGQSVTSVGAGDVFLIKVNP